MIVAPTTLLKNQWIENLEELGINRNDIATKIWDAPNKTFCVVTISSIGNAIRDDWEGLMNTMAKSNFGIKVVDEAHLSLKANLRFDAICNIKHNWYLSATLGRSSPEEDEILNFALADAERFVGDARYEEYQHEYINVYLQDIYYYPSQKLCQQTLKYGRKGLIKATYYQMLMQYKNGVPLINNMIEVMKRSRRLVDYGKMVVVLPLLSIIDKVLEAMEADPFFSKYSFGSVDGSMPLSQKREILDRDIILSTLQSIGTGVDIPGLSIVINTDAFKSPINANQLVGRNRRRKDDKDCYYVDVCDRVKYAKTISNWVEQRRFLLPYFEGIRSEKFHKFPDIHS